LCAQSDAEKNRDNETAFGMAPYLEVKERQYLEVKELSLIMQKLIALPHY